MSATGPLQSAGLRTLDSFRDNLLFQGAQEGDMLVIAFFDRKGIYVLEKARRSARA